MRRVISACMVAWLPLQSGPISTHAPKRKADLVAFRKEAERAIGKPIHINFNVPGVNGGLTFCNNNPVEIAIGKDESEFQDVVVAHEFGHVILCSKGLNTTLRAIDVHKPEYPLMQTVVNSIGLVLGSCYLDPLADKEAIRRGFSFDAVFKDEERKMNDWMPQPTVNTYLQTLVVLEVYCHELREHKAIPIEAKLPGDEAKSLQLLKKNLGSPTCNDGMSCFTLTKKLRDHILATNLFPMTNPQTHREE